MFNNFIYPVNSAIISSNVGNISTPLLAGLCPFSSIMLIDRVTHTVDHMQLCAYFIINQVLHVINSHVHLTVTILSGKMDGFGRQCYMLLTARNDFHIYMNKQLPDGTGI